MAIQGFSAATDPNRESRLILRTYDSKSNRVTTHPVAYREMAKDALADDSPKLILAAINENGSAIKPAWYLNLKLQPMVEIEIEGKRLKAKAETPTGKARMAIWSDVRALCQHAPETIPRTLSGVLLTTLAEQP